MKKKEEYRGYTGGVISGFKSFLAKNKIENERLKKVAKQKKLAKKRKKKLAKQKKLAEKRKKKLAKQKDINEKDNKFSKVILQKEMKIDKAILNKQSKKPTTNKPSKISKQKKLVKKKKFIKPKKNKDETKISLQNTLQKEMKIDKAILNKQSKKPTTNKPSKISKQKKLVKKKKSLLHHQSIKKINSPEEKNLERMITLNEKEIKQLREKIQKIKLEISNSEQGAKDKLKSFLAKKKIEKELLKKVAEQKKRLIQQAQLLTKQEEIDEEKRKLSEKKELIKQTKELETQKKIDKENKKLLNKTLQKESYLNTSISKNYLLEQNKQLENQKKLSKETKKNFKEHLKKEKNSIEKIPKKQFHKQNKEKSRAPSTNKEFIKEISSSEENTLKKTIYSHKKDVEELKKEIMKVVVGHEQVVDGIIRSFLANGHALIEGVPGIAKTLLIRVLAKASGSNFSRIQFTVDLLPTDITGVTTYDEVKREFSTIKGPIFANFIIADEINRAPPKSQSALLEAMQEKQVTIGKETHPLPNPFFVMANNNPLESSGTYPLPEAQIDRFLFKIKMGYTSNEDEEKVIDQNITINNFESFNVKAILSPKKIIEMQKITKKITASPKIKKYIVKIVDATRNPKNYGLKFQKYIEWGCSPRASIGLTIAAKADAFMSGNTYITPQNVKNVAYDVLRHRIILNYLGQAENISTDDVITEILNKIPLD